MSRLGSNIIANYLGNAVIAAASIISIPFYIRYLGVEAYGLIGFFTTMQTVFTVLDFGMGNAVTREIARLSVEQDRSKIEAIRNMVHTIGIIYWVIGLAIGAAVILCAPLIVKHWIIPVALDKGTLLEALMLMGVCIAVRWPYVVYAGGLIGLQLQVLHNVIRVSMEVLRIVGSIVILATVSQTIQVFLYWQAAIGLAMTLLATVFLWRRLPRAYHMPSFRVRQLLEMRRFMAGITGLTITSILLTQMDKVILSKILSLENFGYYAIANALAMGLYQVITPLSVAFYPRFAQLIALNKMEDLKYYYHYACQIMSLLVIPIALVIAIFSKEILNLWLHNPHTAEQTRVILSVLIIGTAINGLMTIPSTMQLAFGHTKVIFLLNAVFVLLLIPLLFIMTSHYGAVGAATVWVLLNAGYITFGAHIMYQRILPEEKWKWYKGDIIFPLVVSLVIVSGGSFLCHAAVSENIIPIILIITTGAAVLLSSLVMPHTRKLALSLGAKR